MDIQQLPPQVLVLDPRVPIHDAALLYPPENPLRRALDKILRVGFDDDSSDGAAASKALLEDSDDGIQGGDGPAALTTLTGLKCSGSHDEGLAHVVAVIARAEEDELTCVGIVHLFGQYCTYAIQYCAAHV